MSIELRPASELANEICGCSDKQQHRRDIVLIETDRQQAVAAEVAQIVAMIRKIAGPASALADWPPRGEVWVLHRASDAIERGEYKETSGE